MRFSGLAISATSGLMAVALAGCSAGSPSATPSAPASGPSWLVVEQGKAASATPSLGSRSASASPTSGLGTAGPGCPDDWSGGSVLIPVRVTAGARSLTATWPRQRTSNYRIAAVPQKIVGGVQPVPVWQPVAAGTACTVTATVRGLASGAAYIIWLDAPNTGFERDGTPHAYSGRSGVVYPG